MPLGENIENPEDDPVRRQVSTFEVEEPAWVCTNISGLSTVVGDQRTHHVRQVFHLFIPFFVVI